MGGDVHGMVGKVAIAPVRCHTRSWSIPLSTLAVGKLWGSLAHANDRIRRVPDPAISGRRFKHSYACYRFAFRFHVGIEVEGRGHAVEGGSR